MLYIYCPRPSEGANELEDALNDAGVPARRTQGKLIRERYRPDRDRIICWGAALPAGTGGANILNNVAPTPKFDEAQRLAAAGVPTVTVSRTRPQVGPATRGSFDLGLNILSEIQVRAMMTRMQAWLDAPLPPAETWLPRRNNHMGGSDLRTPPAAPDFWSRREPIVEEIRIHSFLGKSIRAGIKVPREGMNAHEWIRSFDSGWRIRYDEYKSKKDTRELAAKAVEALGLHFGAVDIGRRADDTLLVLEVNRAPGVEGGTTARYAEAIAGWVRGE
jgi:hypothetical protein